MIGLTIDGIGTIEDFVNRDGKQYHTKAIPIVITNLQN